MSEKPNTETETKTCRTCGPCEKGTTSLLIASIFIGIGTYSWLQNGFIPTSVFWATPPFLIIGLYLRYLYAKGAKSGKCPIDSKNKINPETPQAD